MNLLYSCSIQDGIVMASSRAGQEEFSGDECSNFQVSGLEILQRSLILLCQILYIDHEP